MKKLYGLIVGGMLLLTSCGKQIPDDIIQPDRMEHVLYDYHLASGMTVAKNTVQKEAYRQYVFQKHGINEAEFDSSMVWYTRNSKMLAEIYTNLSKRFQAEEEHVALLIAQKDTKQLTTQKGDSVDIWQQPDILWLANTPLSDITKFDIQSDSNFHPKDRFVWSTNYTVLSEGKVTMGLNLLFDNDSVIGKTLDITQSGIQSIELKPDSSYQLKSINGFIYLHKDSVQKPSILVNDITLMRYHCKDDSTTVAKKPAKQLILKEAVE